MGNESFFSAPQLKRHPLGAQRTMHDQDAPDTTLFILSPRAVVRIPALLTIVALILSLVQSWRPLVEAGSDAWRRLGLVVATFVALFGLLWLVMFSILAWWRVRVLPNGIQVWSGLGRPEFLPWASIRIIAHQSLWGVRFLRLRSPHTGRLLSIALPVSQPEQLAVLVNRYAGSENPLAKFFSSAGA